MGPQECTADEAYKNSLLRCVKTKYGSTTTTTTTTNDGGVEVEGDKGQDDMAVGLHHEDGSDDMDEEEEGEEVSSLCMNKWREVCSGLIKMTMTL